MSRALADLKPGFLAMVQPFLEDWRAQADGYDLIVTCTLRTLEEQASLYAQGRTAPGPIVTNARPGQSAHNYGYAIDVVPVLHGKAIWDGTHPIWQEIGNFGQSRGLQWYGAPDAPFLEDPHFQLPNWRDFV
jgi:peptidoglycan L-alanyl-D-glutamate endopeptidase CwlK